MRHLPRGVKKADYARRDFFDAWLPELAPSAPLVKFMLEDPDDSARWKRFEAKYRREMARPERRRLIATLATLSESADFSVGCYCENPARCHRSILAALLRDAGARVTGP
ncbi:MAG TPA: DUF488 family protein [Usitatibacter sp.]|nr:DUF488 family protein [Usitatibacter sp.]